MTNIFLPERQTDEAYADYKVRRRNSNVLAKRMRRGAPNLKGGALWPTDKLSFGKKVTKAVKKTAGRERSN